MVGEQLARENFNTLGHPFNNHISNDLPRDMIELAFYKHDFGVNFIISDEHT